MKICVPTRTQWEELYEVGQFIKQLRPWDYLQENDTFIVQLRERKEPVFCSVLGAGGMVFGIAVYPDSKSFIEHEMLLAAPKTPNHVFLTRQRCLLCNFGNRAELSNEDYAVIKELGLKFRGRNEWIYFSSLRPGFVPWQPNAEEAEILIGALQNFTMAFRAYAEGKINADFEHGEVLHRYYDETEKLWFNCRVLKPKLKLVHKRVTVVDDVFIARMKAQKKTSRRIEADLVYLPTSIYGKKGEVPHYPHICFVADRSSGMLVEQHFLSDGEKEENTLITMLANFIMQFGRPRLLHIRDEHIEGLIEDFCTKCDIATLKSGNLTVIDGFVEEYMSRVK